MDNSWNKTPLSEIFYVNAYPCCKILHLTVTRPDGYRHLLHVRVIGIIAYIFSFVRWSVLGVLVEFSLSFGVVQVEGG